VEEAALMYGSDLPHPPDYYIFDKDIFTPVKIYNSPIKLINMKQMDYPYITKCQTNKRLIK
jgi:hypothetical protein